MSVVRERKERLDRSDQPEPLENKDSLARQELPDRKAFGEIPEASAIREHGDIREQPELLEQSEIPVHPVSRVKQVFAVRTDNPDPPVLPGQPA